MELTQYYFCPKPGCGPFHTEGRRPEPEETCETCTKVHDFLLNLDKYASKARKRDGDCLEVIILHFRSLELAAMISHHNKMDKLYQLLREAIPDDRNPKVTQSEIDTWGYPMAVTRKYMMRLVHRWDRELFKHVLEVNSFPITIEEFRKELEDTVRDVQQQRKFQDHEAGKLRELVSLPKEFQSLFDQRDHDYLKAVSQTWFHVNLNETRRPDKDLLRIKNTRDERLSQALAALLGEIKEEKFRYIFSSVHSLFRINSEIDRLEQKKKLMLEVMIPEFKE
jgi:hypothetical protein